MERFEQDSALLGAAGEYHAARHYRAQGFSVLASNYRCRFGELDLVLTKKDLVVFCEVKTRRPGSLIPGELAVDQAKQRRLRSAAQHFLTINHLTAGRVRFDVAAVEPDAANDNRFTVRVTEEAFQ